MRRMRHLKPREIQGCQLALDASIPSSLYDATSGGSLVAPDGAVARWEDQSGNARHVTQSTSGFRPLRKAAQQAGLDAVLFDNSDDRMSNASVVVSLPLTSFAVIKKDTFDGTECFADSTVIANQCFHGVDNGTVANSFLAISTGIASVARDTQWGSLLSTFSASAGISIRRGRSSGSTATNASSGFNGAQIGMPRSNSTAYCWNGYISEFCVFDSLLNSQVAQRLIDSRSRKWRTDR